MECNQATHWALPFIGPKEWQAKTGQTIDYLELLWRKKTSMAAVWVFMGFMSALSKHKHRFFLLELKIKNMFKMLSCLVSLMGDSKYPDVTRYPFKWGYEWILNNNHWINLWVKFWIWQWRLNAEWMVIAWWMWAHNERWMQNCERWMHREHMLNEWWMLAEQTQKWESRKFLGLYDMMTIYLQKLL